MGKAHPKTKTEDRNDTPAVDEFPGKLKHPLKAVVAAVRSSIFSADSRITEGIKWNAPSFYCTGWFATTNVRGKEVIVVLHLGAKVNDNSTAGMRTEDPSKLLQ